MPGGIQCLKKSQDNGECQNYGDVYGGANASVSRSVAVTCCFYICMLNVVVTPVLCLEGTGFNACDFFHSLDKNSVFEGTNFSRRLSLSSAVWLILHFVT